MIFKNWILFISLLVLFISGCQLIGDSRLSKKTWHLETTGTYKGFVTTSTGQGRIVTVFEESEGKIRGSYNYQLKKKSYSGDLYNCSSVSVLNLKCTWNENGDEGSVVFSFNDSLSQFGGAWGFYDSNKKFIWNGLKEKEIIKIVYV